MEQGSGAMRDQRILLSGFWSDQREAMQRAGIPVAASIEPVLEGHTHDADLAAGIEAFTHLGMTRAEVGPTYNADIPTDLIRQTFDAAYILFMRAHRRLFQTAPRNAYSWLDVDNHLHRMIHWCIDLLQRQRVTLAVFHNLPHEGAYVVLYEACRTLNIPVLVCSQSVFANRFWAMRDIADYGAFSPMQGVRNTALPLPDVPEVPFYMATLPPENTVSGVSRLLLRERVKLVLKCLGFAPWIKPRVFQKNVGRVSELEQRLVAMRRMEVLYGTFDRNRDYIYFPLHLQPEMSTDAMGGIYADQLRALEELCAAVPEGMVVCVKENPKQGIYMREPSFFDRLEAIPNVVYLPVSVPSFELTRHAAAVATITGSAGWEALISGKPAIVFGHAWYGSLPGAFQWQGPETLEAALAFTPDRDALAGAYGDLTQRMPKGIIDPYYGKMLDTYDRPAAAVELADSMVGLLEDMVG